MQPGGADFFGLAIAGGDLRAIAGRLDGRHQFRGGAAGDGRGFGNEVDGGGLDAGNCGKRLLGGTRTAGTSHAVNLKRDGLHSAGTVARFRGVVEVTARLDVLLATSENGETEWLGNIRSRNNTGLG